MTVYILFNRIRVGELHQNWQAWLVLADEQQAFDWMNQDPTERKIQKCLFRNVVHRGDPGDTDDRIA